MLLTFANPCAAQQVSREGGVWVETTTVTLPLAPTVKVVGFLGNVQVRAAAAAPKYVLRKRSAANSEQEARSQFSRLKISASKRGEVVVIQPQSYTNERMVSELIIEVPKHVEHVQITSHAGRIAVTGPARDLQLETHSGDIILDDAGALRAVTLGGGVIVNGVIGSGQIRTGAGNVRVKGAKGKLEIASMGGNVDVGTVSSAEIRAGGGDVAVLKCVGPLTVQDMGGNVTLGDVDGPVIVDTGGGAIRIGSAHGPVKASTGAGNIELWKAFGAVQARTGAGSITAQLLGVKRGAIESLLLTSAGNVVVYLDPRLPLSVQAAAEMGSGIRSEFPDLRVITSQDFGPRKSVAEGAINGGGPALKVRTTIGQIEFRKAK